MESNYLTEIYFTLLRFSAALREADPVVLKMDVWLCL